MKRIIIAGGVAVLLMATTGCQFNSSGWPIIWGMHNGAPVPREVKQTTNDESFFSTNGVSNP